MPRQPRLVDVGATYHITARGNRRQAIFLDDYDRRRFLALMANVVVRHRWQCGAYCLLDNHFHLLVETPVAAGDLSAGMHRLNGCYAQWFNVRHDLDGHLFQDRFHSELIEGEGHLLETIRYILLNPVRAGSCAAPGDWPWSSYGETLGSAAKSTFLSTSTLLDLFARDADTARRRLYDFLVG